MRNKLNIQRTLSNIESIQQSLIQFIRNTPISENERHFFDRTIKESERAFDQIRTYLNQEDEDFRG